MAQRAPSVTAADDPGSTTAKPAAGGGAVDADSCYHCGLPLVAGQVFSSECGGDTRLFCCPACRAVAATIYASGLGSFYRYNTPSGQASEAALVDDDFLQLDDPAIQQAYVSEDPPGQRQTVAVTLMIGGMHCAACTWLLESYLGAIPGVDSVTVSQADQTAWIRWRRDSVHLSELFRAIARLGYEPQFYTPDQLARARQREFKALLGRLGVAGIAMMQVGMFAIALYAGAMQDLQDSYRDYLRWISALVATPVVLYSAQPFFKGAWRGLRHRSPGMDLPVAVAIAIAYLASLHATFTAAGEVYFDSVAMFTFLLLLSRFLELRARLHSASARSDLYSLLPSLVTRLSPGGSGVRETVPLSTLAVGDQVLVKAGQVIPVDGVVASGSGEVSAAHLTGEFASFPSQRGDEVVAGSVLESGVLTVRAESVGAQLKLAAISTLLARAQLSKPRLAHLADRLATRFVIAVLGLAAATYLYWRWLSGQPDEAFRVMLSVLVVSCPCALSLATPTALTAAANQLRQRGLLVSNGEVWEKAGTITDVVFDKTGTLTRGQLTVAGVEPLASAVPATCLQIAGALEIFSDHPIAQALQASAPRGWSAQQPAVHPRGVEATVEGRRYRIGSADFVAGFGWPQPDLPAGSNDGIRVLLGDSERPLCWIQLKDCLRDDADQCVAALKGLGCKLHLLSGDNSGEVERLAQALRLDRWQGGMTPAEKLASVNTLQASGRQVLMVGDGINDIPVLAAADISMAMANASDLAKTQADTIALSGQLMSILWLLEQAQRARSIVRQNLCWALAYNLLAIPLAAAGWVPPWAAALGMSLSSLVVVGNALRLQRRAQQGGMPSAPPQSGNSGGAVG